MIVVTAGVHDADGITVVQRAHARTEGNVHHFRDGESVHVGTKGDDRARSAPAQDADDASVRHVGSHLHPKRAQVVSDESGCPRLAIAQLGMLVDVAPPGHHLRRDGLHALPHLRWRLRGKTSRSCGVEGDDREPHCGTTTGHVIGWLEGAPMISSNS
jgi:hypothetical protein